MPRRLLLVEDEPGLVMTLTDRLVAEGYEVESEGDAVKGLARGSTGAFDAILLDVMLPGGSGFDSGFGLELTDGGGLADGTGYKIVVAGLDFGAQTCYPSGRCLVDDDFLIARWNNNGTPDNTFNNLQDQQAPDITLVRTFR